ncbi:hypothetical protein [Celerinatantimonas yamalensis]|uniref:Uncharacterized protein n=1 Tax=Celerinatantimonas yamalensis TaxID=559956 RepID=A0ABW9G897_9GAMM
MAAAMFIFCNYYESWSKLKPTTNRYMMLTYQFQPQIARKTVIFFHLGGVLSSADVLINVDKH